MNKDRIEKAAAFMHQTHQDGSGHRPIPEDIRPAGVDEAYAAQEAFHRLRTGQATPQLAGYKVAATSKVIQEQVGLTEPFLGAVMPGTVHSSPYELRHADCLQFGFECEIAARLGQDLRAADAPHSRESVAAAVEKIYPAFELLDMRNCVLSAVDAMSAITDNAMIRGIVLGTEVSDWQSRDIGNLAGRLFVNGESAGAGNTRDALGHPFEGLAWMANNLAARGHGMQAGMVVITGSIIATQFPGPGDAIRYEVDGLGQVELNVV